MSTIKVNHGWNETELSRGWFDKILIKSGWRVWSENNNNSFLKYENRAHGGRADVTLFTNGRPVVCVELKRPSVNIVGESLHIHFEQAWKYGHSMAIWRSGKKISPLGILTNGIHCILFDASLTLEDSLRGHILIDLSKKNDLPSILNRIRIEQSGHAIHSVLARPIQTDLKDEAASADKRFSIRLQKMYTQLEKKMSKKNAFQTTISLFLASVLRDCGFYPPAELRSLELKKDWKGLISGLQKILHTDLTPLLMQSNDAGWEFYDQTRHFPVRLDVFPPDCLGKVYEDLLHHVNPSESTTSYYTPSATVDTVIEKLEIKLQHKILDPTCGSAAFLAGAVEYFGKNQKIKSSQLKNYIENNLVGVDKDWFACQISRAALISAYAKLLTYDPIFDAPKTKIIESDFFDFSTKIKFDVVVGNPPWGSIDRKDVKIVSGKHRESLKSYEVYCKNSDLSLYILQKSILHLNKKGKLALLVKQQILESQYKDSFYTWAKKNNLEIWDYGHTELFDNPASLTALIYYGTCKSFKKINKFEKKSLPKIKLIPFKKFFDFSRGFQSQADDLYKSIAKRIPKASFVKNLAPTSKTMNHFSMNSSDLEQIAFINKSPTKNEIELLTDSEKKQLRARPQAGDSTQFSWIGRDSINLYDFEGKQNRIFTGRILNGGRLTASIDFTGKTIGITSHTILIPKTGTDSDVLYATLAWMNSIYFKTHMLDKKCKRMANKGVASYPSQFNQLGIPSKLLKDKNVVQFAKKLCTKRFGASENDLLELDALIAKSLSFNNKQLDHKKVAA